MVENYFSVCGEKIEFEIKLIDIFDLNYYPKNPRINSILEQFQGNATQEDIETEMWDKLEYITHELYRDIKYSGDLQDEIIVYNNEVLEGNSRLCAYRHLYKKEPDKEKWNKIRAKIIKSPLNHKQINTLLCQWHIKGKKDWDPFEKAAYMIRMNEEDNMEISEISQLTNFSGNDVNNHINAYKFMKSKGVTDIRKFSYYLEKEKLNQKLAPIRKKEPDIDDKISEWIIKEKIPEARAMRQLPDILKDKKSRNAFEKNNEDFVIAVAIAKNRNPSIEDTFYRKIDETIKLLRNAKPEKLREDIQTNNSKKAKIKYLAREVKRICKNLDIDF